MANDSKKTTSINMRVEKDLLARIRTEAEAEGIPYQTMISRAFHDLYPPPKSTVYIETNPQSGWTNHVRSFWPKLEGSHVYIVQSLDTVKIGYSANIRYRMQILQMGNAYQMHLRLAFPGGEAEEQEMHKRFEAHRMRGEWFRLSEEIEEFIKSHPLYTGSQAAPVQGAHLGAQVPSDEHIRNLIREGIADEFARRSLVEGQMQLVSAPPVNPGPAKIQLGQQLVSGANVLDLSELDL